jgi:hypothetical protein
MNQLVNSVTVLLSAVIGVAILSVIVSRNANTTGVISSASQGFEGILSTAMGNGSGLNGGSLGSLSLPQMSF